MYLCALSVTSDCELSYPLQLSLLIPRWDAYAKRSSLRKLRYLLNLQPFDWYEIDAGTIINGGTANWPHFVHA